MLTRATEPGYAQADADIGASLQQTLASRVPVLHVWNKSDAAGVSTQGLRPDDLPLSAKTGTGLAALRQRLLDLVGWQGGAAEGLFMARERHVQALQQAQTHLALAVAHAARADGALDLLAEELRLAHNALGTITGAFSADDLLGEIFTRFCIGK